MKFWTSTWRPAASGFDSMSLPLDAGIEVSVLRP
jgi:hypothetical protein